MTQDSGSGSRAASFVAGAAFVLLCSGSFAADVPESVTNEVPFPEERWQVGVAPYLWMSGINGSVGQFGLPPVHIDASFTDLLENLDMALMMVAEAKKGRFGIFTDLIYSDLSVGGTGPGGVLTVDLGTKMFTGTAMLEYSVLQDDRSTLDLMAGARVWAVNTDASITSGVPPLNFTGNDDAVWVDPMIGVKGRTRLSEAFYLVGWGMIGGFGVSSDLGWDVMGAVGYDVTERFSMVVGYRANGVDYQDGPFVFDVVMDGPIIGGAYRF